MHSLHEAPALVGTVYAAARAVLEQAPGFQAFITGAMSRENFGRLIEASASALQAAGVPAADLPFIKRFPRQPHAYANGVLADLHRRGILPAAGDIARLVQPAPAIANYDHGPFKTFIYPEEGLLLAAIAAIEAPRHAIFLGSYYGYWAHWAIPGIKAAGGRVTLVDPNPLCCEIARRNLAAGGVGDAVQVVVAQGEDFLAATTAQYDLVVLDAENPRDHPDPHQRGKRVYHSLLQACLPRLTAQALLVCHNILFTDHSGDPAFDAVIVRNRDELGEFAGLVARHFGPFIEYRITEGVGIGRRGGSPGTGIIAAEVDADAPA